MSLRVRVHLLVTGLTLLFLALGLSLMLDETRGQIREEIEASNRITAQLMTTVVFSSQLLSRGPTQQDVVLEFLERLGRVRANEIRLHDHHGTRVYVSPPSRYKAGRHAPDWFAALVAPQLPVARLQADRFTVEIAPDASRSVLDAWDDLVRVAWLTLAFFVLVNGLLYAVVGRAFRPLHSVLEGFARAERGDLSTRLPEYRLPELRAIGLSFNRMLAQLQRTLAAEQDLAENRGLTRRIQGRLEDERRVLARELHDQIGQYLTAIHTIAQATANRTQTLDAQTHAASRAIVDSAARIYDAMHDIIRRLRPMTLEGMGLADTLREAVEEWRRLHAPLRFTLDLPDDPPRLSDEAEIALFRIAQEGVTNAVRHARAQTVRLALRIDDDGVELCVDDDGVGLAPADARQADRYGLLGMRERAQALSGSLHIDSTPGGGTRIRVRLPLTQAAP